MHASSYHAMERFIAERLAGRPGLRVLDVGAYNVNGTYRRLFAEHDYVGADVRAGPNVDLVLPDPYRWGIVAEYDVVISGQTMEHVEDLEAFARAIAAALKPGGLCCLITPWTWGHHEYPVDCWRILPAGMDWLLRRVGLLPLDVHRSGRDTIGIAARPTSSTTRPGSRRPARRTAGPVVVQVAPVRPSPPVTLTGKLAVCCAYFNPARYETRRANFARFRDAALEQAADLWVIEAETGPPFEVAEQEGVHVLHLPMPAKLWQKERALNKLISHLPPEYDRVAWVDGDLLFDNPRWVADTRDALQRHRVVQCFGEAVYLDRADEPSAWHGEPNAIVRESVGKRIAGGATVPAHFGRTHPGFAWAARRDVIQAIGGLYDRHVLGSGDTMMAVGFYGWFEHANISRYARNFLQPGRQWCARAYEVVQGDVGFIAGQVRHLWHGSRADRHYNDRITALGEAGFDANEHLVADPSGLWAWSPTASPEMRELAEGYFDLRREDG